MPGVPSGKGCEACRKQKKKCDQLKPACSRCTRLKIVCVGSGQQRYKFLEEDGISNSSTKRSLAVRTARTPPSSQSPRSSQSLSRTPSSDEMLLSNALIVKLKVKDDLRRIGTNEALDTAVDALVSAHSRFGTAVCAAANDPECLSKYTHAVTTLRLCLDDPVKARQTNTLAAVLLLLICQLFLGQFVDRRSGHTEGAAIILKTRGYGKPEDEFERLLVLTLRGPVLFESLYNTRISFTDQEWKTLVKNPLDGELPRGNMMSCFAHVPDLMRRGHLALQTNSDTQPLIKEARTLYTQLRTMIDEHLETYDATKSPSSPLKIRIHAHHQRMLGLGLAIILVFHCILNGLGDSDLSRHLESELHIDAVLDLAVHAMAFRPLGSSYILLCLAGAWAATDDEVVRAMIIETYQVYQNDFPLPKVDLEAELEITRQRLVLLKG